MSSAELQLKKRKCRIFTFYCVSVIIKSCLRNANLYNKIFAFIEFNKKLISREMGHEMGFDLRIAKGTPINWSV